MKLFLDKVKICYTLAEQSILHDLMRNTPDEYEHPEWGFNLTREEGSHFDCIYRIIYLERTSNSPTAEYDLQCFGRLKWGLRSDKSGEMNKFVWIEMENQQLYLNYNYNTKSRMVYLEYIEAMLGLCFHNLTALDIAIDDYKNLSKRLIRSIRNENLIPIVNGTKIEDRDKLIDDILYIGVGNRRRILEYNLIVQQKNKNIRLAAYNKKREIEHKGGTKSYILDSNGNPAHLHRLEVRISSDALREYFGSESIEYNPMMFTDELWLLKTFIYFASRVLRFQSTVGRKTYNVLQMVA